ncbi:MAG: hypothetical protein WCT40_00200 [Candidatus Magasanikbacteria bacterium]|jgi:hypothetical protein
METLYLNIQLAILSFVLLDLIFAFVVATAIESEIQDLRRPLQKEDGGGDCFMTTHFDEGGDEDRWGD